MTDEREISLDEEEEKGPPGSAPKTIKEGTIVKESLFKRFIHGIFVAGPKEVKESIITDVLKPAIRDTIADSLYAIVDTAIYGREGGRVKRGRTVGGKLTSGTDYNGISTGRRRSTDVGRTSAEYDFDDIWFPDRRDCDDIYDALVEELIEHDWVSVYYYFEVCGKTAQHPDHNWGWTSLEGTSYKHTANGYALKLPKPEQRRR